MTRFLRLAAILVLFLAVSLHGGDKKRLAQNYQLKPDQTASLKPVRLVTAKQNCENWAVAAGLEQMLEKQGVALDQNFWVMRLNGGELCVPNLPSLDALSHVVNGEFVLDDGRHVRLELQITPGAPSHVDFLIAGLQQQKIMLVFFRGHAYYLAGVTYDEYIGKDGGRLFEIKELRLANTFAGLPGVAFLRGRDDTGEIGGVISLSVTAL